MTLLTDKQLEELVKAGAAAIAAYHGGEENEDDEAHVRLALTAALPVIERAVLERAARRTVDEADTLIESLREGVMTDAGLTEADRFQMRAQVDVLDVFKEDAARSIRALAGEVG